MPRGLFFLVAVCIVAPVSAYAQAFRTGTTFFLGGNPPQVDFSDVAYDSVNNLYMQVSEEVAHTTIEARVVDPANGLVLHRFRVNGPAAGAQFPRVEFGRGLNGGAGGYLVTWHESVGHFAQVRGRFLAANAQPLSEVFIISPLGTSWLAAADIAYSTGSNEFAISWMTVGGDVHFERVSPTGAPLGGGVVASTPLFEREPSVAYNPDTNEFYIAYSIHDDNPLPFGRGWVAGRRVKAGTGEFLGATQQFGPYAATKVPNVAYNAERRQYLLTWCRFTATGQIAFAAVLNGVDGLPVGELRTLAAYAAYDAIDVSFNQPSGEYLLVTHHQSGEDLAVSVTTDGHPVNTGFLVTSTGVDGNFWPRVATSTREKKWLVVTSTLKNRVSGQFVVSNSNGNGGPPPPPPPSCSFTLSSSSAAFGPLGGSGGFSVTASDSTCASNAGSSAAWVALSSGTGTGSRTVNFSVAANASGAARTAVVSVGGQSYTVSQAARIVRPGANDIGGDGLTDLLWFNQATQQTAIWELSGSNVVATSLLHGGTAVEAGWTPSGAGDLNADGYADVIWRHTNGELAAWLMQGTTPAAIVNLRFPGGAIAFQSDPNWTLAAVGDLNGDGSADLVWQHAGGGLAAWTMSGINIVETRGLSIGAVDPNWKVAGAGDINADGKADIVFQHTNGAIAAWLMNGFQVVATNLLTANVTDEPGWKIRGVGDVNGDGYADLLWQHTGNWLAVWYLNTFNVTYGSYLSIPRLADLNWQVVGPG